MSVRDLFGGAMRIEVPSEWIDTEAFMDIIKRPVPDNQEIFMSPQNTADDSPDAARPIALFVDILELATDVVDLDQLPYFHVIEILKRDERADEIEGLVVAPGSPLELHLSSTWLPEDAGEISATAATFEGCDVEVVVGNTEMQTRSVSERCLGSKEQKIIPLDNWIVNLIKILKIL